MLQKDKRAKRERELKKPQRWSVPGAMVFRMFVIGSIAIVASVWAIWRHYSVPRPPLLVPASTERGSAPSASEIPAPTLE